jgi:hypothetical protein
MDVSPAGRSMKVAPIKRSVRFRRRHLLGAFALVAFLVSGCGSGSGVSQPTIAPARTYHLAGFRPATPAAAGRPTRVSFTIIQPSGAPLTAYREGSGPHNGVDLIIVRSDDSHLLYEDTDIARNGKITQPVVFPAPGRYRMIIDAYPKQTSPTQPFNFQLFTWVTVQGKATRQPLPAFHQSVSVDGYRFTLPSRLSLHAIDPVFMPVSVRDPQGRPARFTLWRGALAHAIFIRAGSLDYFHTHVCPPGANNCSSVLGTTKIAGTSSTPGKLTVGVLVPLSGTWHLFLLTYIDGHQLTAPFTLKVS